MFDRCKLIATASLLNKCLTDGVEAENFALAHENQQKFIVSGIGILQSTDRIARQQRNHGFWYGNLLVDLTIECVPKADQVIDAPRHQVMLRCRVDGSDVSLME